MTTTAHHLTLGEPQVAGPLAVFPVFGPAPRLGYRSFAQAVALGALVKELRGGASVNDLVLGNPTDLPLLVYEGEEVLGAQQNRTFDVSVLLDKQRTARVPVTCVEVGRWDGRRHAEPLAASPQAADPAMRARKRTTANDRALVGLEARPEQNEVWEDVQERLITHGVASDTAAMSDLYDGLRDELGAASSHVRAVDDQIGAVAMISGRPAAVDLVSRADVFADLLPRLAQGYALDALRGELAEPDAFEAERFLDAALSAPRHDLPTPGMGRGLRIDSPVVAGSGLVHDGELVQLCAFPAWRGGGHRSVEGGRIARPSRRRR